MLRHDRLHTPVPPNIEQRLRQSTEAATPTGRSLWWGVFLEIGAMKSAFHFFSSLSTGPRLLLGLFALGFPLVLLGHYTHTIEVYSWLAFSPHQV